MMPSVCFLSSVLACSLSSLSLLRDPKGGEREEERKRGREGEWERGKGRKGERERGRETDSQILSVVGKENQFQRGSELFEGTLESNRRTEGKKRKKGRKKKTRMPKVDFLRTFLHGVSFC